MTRYVQSLIFSCLVCASWARGAGTPTAELSTLATGDWAATLVAPVVPPHVSIYAWLDRAAPYTLAVLGSDNPLTVGWNPALRVPTVTRKGVALADCVAATDKYGAVLFAADYQEDWPTIRGRIAVDEAKGVFQVSLRTDESVTDLFATVDAAAVGEPRTDLDVPPVYMEVCICTGHGQITFDCRANHDAGCYDLNTCRVNNQGDCGYIAVVQTLLADMNCDGLRNNGDIDGFILALTDLDGYYEAYPDCSHLNADCNEDGYVNNGDIDAFLELIGL